MGREEEDAGRAVERIEAAALVVEVVEEEESEILGRRVASPSPPLRAVGCERCERESEGLGRDRGSFVSRMACAAAEDAAATASDAVAAMSSSSEKVRADTVGT